MRLPQASLLVNRADIPDVPPALVQAITGAPNALLLGAPAEVWQARSLLDADDKAAGEQALRAAVSSYDAATAWSACNELGVALAMTDITRDETPQTREGVGYLLTAAGAPFADVAAAAVWNLSQILRLAGRASAADRYAWAAHDLGDPVALDYAVDSSTESSNEDVVRQTLVATVRAGSRLHRGRIEAEKKLAESALEAASAPARSWFTSAQGKLLADDWMGITKYVVDSAAYNVENNLVGLTAGGEMTPMLTGFGDGIYPVLTLHEANVTIGTITVFKNLLSDLRSLGDVSPEIYSLSEAGPGVVLGAMLESAAPLVLKTVTVTDGVVFGDASRASNGRDVIVDVPLPAGDYSVVVWMSIPLDAEDTIMRPIAFGLLSGAMVSTLNLRLPALQPSEVELILNETAFNPNVRFSNHTKDVVPGLLRRNLESERADDRRLSWLLQLAEVEPTDDVFAAVHGYPLPDEARARRVLVTRGYDNPVLGWKTWPAAAPVVETSNVTMQPVPTTPVTPGVQPSRTPPPATYIPPSRPPAAAPTHATAPAPTSTAFCTGCGAKRQGDARFCTSCGTKFN